MELVFGLPSDFGKLLKRSESGRELTSEDLVDRLDSGQQE